MNLKFLYINSNEFPINLFHFVSICSAYHWNGSSWRKWHSVTVSIGASVQRQSAYGVVVSWRRWYSAVQVKKRFYSNNLASKLAARVNCAPKPQRKKQHLLKAPYPAPPIAAFSFKFVFSSQAATSRYCFQLFHCSLTDATQMDINSMASLRE